MTHARRRRMTLVIVVVLCEVIYLSYGLYRNSIHHVQLPSIKYVDSQNARIVLDTLEVHAKAPFSGYTREQFGQGWAVTGGCDTRNRILARDLTRVSYLADGCSVKSGVLADMYTAKDIEFARGSETSDLVQIDHIVALANAWQTGAQDLPAQTRLELANDPLNLMAVDGPANQEKGSGDAATWLPPNSIFRCRYVARQISVKSKYRLWVTQAEHDAMIRVLFQCPDQQLPIEVQP